MFSWLSLFISCVFGGPLQYSTLQKADGAYVNSKFLICSSNVHGSNVHDWQAGCFHCFVLKDGIAPPAWMPLLGESRHCVTTAFYLNRNWFSYWYLYPPCSHPPSHCRWSGCYPLHGFPHHWIPAEPTPSSGFLWPGPCKQYCFCSDRWGSGMLQWTRALGNSAGCWQSWE